MHSPYLRGGELCSTLFDILYRRLSEQMNIHIHIHTCFFLLIYLFNHLSQYGLMHIFYTMNYSLILHYLFSYLNYFGFSHWEFIPLSPLSLGGT